MPNEIVDRKSQIARAMAEYKELYTDLLFDEDYVYFRPIQEQIEME